MKGKAWFRLLLIIGLIASLNSCDAILGSEEKADTPKIIDAGFFPQNHPEAYRYTSIAVGQDVDLYAIVDDKDLDAIKVIVSQTNPDNTISTLEIPLASQISERTLYLLARSTAVGPLGTYQLRLTPVDEKGNKGSTFRINYLITN